MLVEPELPIALDIAKEMEELCRMRGYSTSPTHQVW